MSVLPVTPPEVVARLLGDVAPGTPINDFGVPLHACNGIRQDEHYWARLKDSNAHTDALRFAAGFGGGLDFEP